MFSVSTPPTTTAMDVESYPRVLPIRYFPALYIRMLSPMLSLIATVQGIRGRTRSGTGKDTIGTGGICYFLVYFPSVYFPLFISLCLFPSVFIWNRLSFLSVLQLDRPPNGTVIATQKASASPGAVRKLGDWRAYKCPGICIRGMEWPHSVTFPYFTLCSQWMLPVHVGTFNKSQVDVLCVESRSMYTLHSCHTLLSHCSHCSHCGFVPFSCTSIRSPITLRNANARTRRLVCDLPSHGLCYLISLQRR